MLNHNVVLRGGTYFRAFNFARHLVLRGHEVTVVTISSGARFKFREYVQDGVAVVESPDLLWGRGRSGWDPWDTLMRIEFLRKRHFDLIHGFDSRPVVILPALQLRRKRAVPLVLDWADWWGHGGTQAERPGRAKFLYSKIETFFEDRFRVRADRTTVASRLLFDRAASLGVKPGTIQLLPGGADPARISFHPDPDIRPRFGLGKDDFVVGYMGAASLGDAHLLFNAVRRLRVELPNARLLAIGPTIAGSRLPFGAQVPTDLRKAVAITPFLAVSELPAVLSACDVLVLPLRATLANRARWPSRIGDYLAVGLPIVATRVSDAQDLFASDIGILTSDSPADLASGLLSVARNPERAKIFGQNARRLAQGEMSWETLTARLDHVYRSAIG